MAARLVAEHLLRTVTRASMPAAVRFFSAITPISPEPTTSAFLPSRLPSCFCAACTAMVPTEMEQLDSPVLLLVRLAVVIAARNRVFITVPDSLASRASVCASLTCRRISSSPITWESSPDATRNRYETHFLPS